MRYLTAGAGGLMFTLLLLLFMVSLLRTPTPQATGSTPFARHMDRVQEMPEPDKSTRKTTKKLPDKPVAMRLPALPDDLNTLRLPVPAGALTVPQRITPEESSGKPEGLSGTDLQWKNESLLSDQQDALVARFQPAPLYPHDARREGVTGHVRLQITVTPDGRVSDARVIDSQPARVFDAAALAAVRKWRYQARDSSISLVQDIELAFTLEQP